MSSSGSPSPKGVHAIISSTARTINFDEIVLTQIQPNKHQPRRKFNDEELKTLVESIQAVGILQPILVKAIDSNQYELIAGERRFRAATMAGLNTIPAVIKSAEGQDSLEQALAENLHRVELSPLEEAAAYKSLIDDFGLTQEEVAKRVQKSRAVISNTIRLTGLPAPVLKMMQEEVLSAGHGRALLSLKTAKQQITIAKKAVKENWSVRKLEQFAKSHSTPSQSSTTTKPRSAVLVELENKLANHLNTKATIQLLNKGKGKITIDFADLEDLERIYKKMGG